MTETTTETTSLDIELVAQAARLVAPVSNGSARSRRVFPVPPPPPSVWTAASTPQPLAQPARTPAPSDVADLRAWEEAAEQLEPDWATPVDDEDVPEHTAPLVADVADAGTSEAIAIVEANIAAAPPTSANDEPTEKTDADSAASQSSVAPEAPRTEASTSTESESELEALARAVTKNALDTLATRRPAPGRPLPAPPTASRAPVPPPHLAVSRPSSPLVAAAASRTPLPAPASTRPISPLSPPASRPLPPLTPAPSRPPAAPAFRSPQVPPPAPSRAPASPPVAAPRAQLPTLPRMADLEPRPELAAPSLFEIRNSPLARRFYAQLGVAAVFGALLATILFALVPRQPTSVSVTPSQPATTAETKPAPVVAAKTQEASATADTIPPPPVANVSVDDLEREPAAAAQARSKTATAGLPAAAVPAALKLPATAPAPATQSTGAAAAKPEALAPGVAAAKGTLHINAVPAANVAIDGRPLGMTPKIVRLSPGAHRVALIGPGGRRSQTVNVAAGQSATVSVKF